MNGISPWWSQECMIIDSTFNCQVHTYLQYRRLSTRWVCFMWLKVRPRPWREARGTYERWTHHQLAGRRWPKILLVWVYLRPIHQIQASLQVSEAGVRDGALRKAVKFSASILLHSTKREKMVSSFSGEEGPWEKIVIQPCHIDNNVECTLDVLAVSSKEKRNKKYHRSCIESACM